MPLRLHIDETRRRLCTRAEGLVTFAEMRAPVHTELSPDAAAYSELIDCTGATTNITGDEIRKLAKERQTVDERQRRPGAVAIVATDNVFFGVLRMFDMLMDRVRPIRDFRNVQEAVQRLDDIAGLSGCPLAIGIQFLYRRKRRERRIGRGRTGLQPRLYIRSDVEFSWREHEHGIRYN